MPASDFLTTQTLGGYLVCILVAGGFSYRYFNNKKPVQTSKGAKAAVEPRKETNAKKQRKAAFASSKPTTEDKGSSSATDTTPTTWLSNDPKDEVDNTDFAKRMATVKEGKKFTGKSAEQKKKTKSVKQSRAAEPSEKATQKKSAEVAEAKEPVTSTPAVEADEDESPATSPEVAPVDASGVSDMLEPAAAGPSVLRLTGTDKEKPKAKAQKAPEQAETKKQRQNRLKNEAKKAAREEEEKERKVKLEKQRRTAREAAGIPAKDGSQFMAAVNGKQSAWTAGSANGTSANGSSAAIQPLDTFEAPAKNGTAAPTQTSDSWISSLPSEEEQLERLKEEDEWNTVPAKASKKAKKEARAPSPEPVSAAPAQSRPIAQAVQKPAASNGKAAKPAPSYGSFSALSTEEEEWDV
ncbi:hypothetical protein EsH8_I_000808 [Colletotrichum jinshuiense]